jgi:hypothetical protein
MENLCGLALESHYISAMKMQLLDIDISDPKKLSRAKLELTRLLKIVDFALLQHAGGESLSPQPELPMRGIHALSGGGNNGHGPKEIDRRVIEIIDGLPNRFTTTDVILGFRDEAKEKRPQIKLALKRAVLNELIRVEKLGQGRRPSEYEKIHKAG